MSATTAHSEVRLASLLDERDRVQSLHEEVLVRIDQNEDKMPDEVQKEQIKGYRERATALDEEIKDLNDAVQANRTAMEASKAIRRALAGSIDGVDASDDGLVYRSMAAFARDVIVTRESPNCSKIAAQFGDKQAVQSARERLELAKRAPDNTLSSDVAGLIPDQHIAQIFQVIDASRPLVASATRATLERGRLSFPKVTQRPVVEVQATEKTEAGNQAMNVEMVEATASTYLGGGDLSWQAINWSTPNALDLWFRLAAADYALKTESDAGEVLQSAGFLNVISPPLDGTDTYADWVNAIVEGAGDVYSNSGRIADTIYVAPDQFYAFAALQTGAPAAFVNGNVQLGGQNGSFAGLSVVVSRGLDAGVAIVGDSQALLVAETAGAPVELRVVEPAIGGLEVGIIGAFEAVVVEDEAFALLTTAS